MEVRVLHGNGQTETRPTNSARPWLVTAPEAVEDLPGLTGLKPHAMVTNRDRHRGVIAFDEDVDRMTLAVLDGVDQEIAQDSFNSPGFDLGLSLATHVHGDLGVVRLGERCVGLNHPMHQIAKICLLEVEYGRPCIEARDLQ